MAAHNIWNSLLIDIRNTDCLSTFHNKLKALFTAAYTQRATPTTAPLCQVFTLTSRRSTNLLLCYVILGCELLKRVSLQPDALQVSHPAASKHWSDYFNTVNSTQLKFIEVHEVHANYISVTKYKLLLLS